MFEKINLNKNIKKLEIMNKNIKNLNKNQKIYYFNDNFIDELSNKFYLGMPLSKLYYENSKGRCFATATTYSMCFDNYSLVIGNLKNLAYASLADLDNDNTWCTIKFEAKQMLTFEPTFYHAFLIVFGKELNKFGKCNTSIDETMLDDNKQYVVDFVLKQIIEKDVFYKLYGVEEKFLFNSNELKNCNTIKLLQYFSNEEKSNRDKGINNYSLETFKKYCNALSSLSPINSIDKRLINILSTDLIAMSQRYEKIKDYSNQVEFNKVDPYEFLK